MRYFGITGPPEGGKDTFADILVEQARLRGLVFRRVAMSDAIVEEVAQATGFSALDILREKARWRRLLQVWANEFRREFYGSDYWLCRLSKQIESFQATTDGLVLTGLRFWPEYNFISVRGGTIIRIWRRRPGLLFRYSHAIRSFFRLEHPAEQNWCRFPVDFELYNDGAVTDLVTKADNLLDIYYDSRK